MGAKQEAQDWADLVRRYGERHEVTYEPIGGINPKDAPVALCVGGTNRLTGQLVEGFWGASCDADEREIGGFLNKALLPTAILAKAHMPDLARVVPAETDAPQNRTIELSRRYSSNSTGAPPPTGVIPMYTSRRL